MSESRDRGSRSAEVRRLRRMLKELAELSQHASLTGSLRDGAAAAVRRYNAAIERLNEIDVPTTGFTPLPAGAGYDELAVESASLAGYLQEEENGAGGSCGGKSRGMKLVVGLAPFIDQDALVDLVKANTSPDDQLDPGLIIALAPFLPRHEISRLVRENMQDLRRGGDTRENVETDSHPSEERAGSVDRSMITYAGEPAPSARAGNDLSELKARLEEMSLRLSREDIPEEERDRLVNEVTQIAGRYRESRRSLTSRGE